MDGDNYGIRLIFLPELGARKQTPLGSNCPLNAALFVLDLSCHRANVVRHANTAPKQFNNLSVVNT
jgi:hypothetical protein